MITWPVAIVLLGITAALCFMAWLHLKREMEKEHHVFQERAFGLEEKKFEVWRTAQLAHTAQHGGEAKRIVQRALAGISVPPEMVPNGGKVVSMFDRTKKSEPTHAMIRADDIDGEPTPERMQEIAEVLSRAKDLPEDEARALLEQHGISAVQFIGGDDA